MWLANCWWPVSYSSHTSGIYKNLPSAVLWKIFPISWVGTELLWGIFHCFLLVRWVQSHQPLLLSAYAVLHNFCSPTGWLELFFKMVFMNCWRQMMFILWIMEWKFMCAKTHITVKYANNSLGIVQILLKLDLINEGESNSQLWFTKLRADLSLCI